MLIGLPILDGKSYRLIDHIEQLGHDIDADGGDHVLIRPVGDPAKCGSVFDRIRGETLREQESRKSDAYVKNYVMTGREPFYRGGQMRVLRDHYGLRADDLPCFIFRSGLNNTRVAMLKIERTWHNNEAFHDGFVDCFREWLRSEDVKSLASSDLELPANRARLQTSLHELSETITSRIKKSYARDLLALTGPSPGTLLRLNVPAGTRWDQIRIKFVDGHTVSIVVGSRRGVSQNYTDMGMKDGRDGRPTAQWKLLRSFAEGKGELTWESSDATRMNQKRKENLSVALREFFGIDDDPFEYHRSTKGWSTRFRIASE